MTDIIVVEDDKPTNERLTALLRGVTDANVCQAYSRADAAKLIAAQKFQLAIVDIDLGPEPSQTYGKYGGFSLLGALAAAGTPTIVVSGILEENLPGMAYALQAYDFITKPITDAEFVNKVRHGLAWKSTNGMGTQDAGTTWPENLLPDPQHNPGLLWKGKPVRLSMTEYRLVYKLLKTPGIAVDKDILAEEMGSATSHGVLTTHISGIRKKFKDVDTEFKAIETEPGKGYAWRSI